MSSSTPSLDARSNSHPCALPSEVATLTSLLALDKRGSLRESILNAVSQPYELYTQQFEPSEHWADSRLSHHSLISALITAVPCPETEHRSNAQQKVVQKDDHVKAWHEALKLALDTENEDMIQNAEDELDLAVDESANAWTALARCTLEDLRAWRSKLKRLEDGLNRGENRETKVSIWK